MGHPSEHSIFYLVATVIDTANLIKHLLRAKPSSMLSTFHSTPQLISQPTNEVFYYPHITDGETEA